MTDEVRISDAERERYVDLLRHHCADGRLTLDEFSDRVGAVYEAKTSTDIERVLTDLPGGGQVVPVVSVGSIQSVASAGDRSMTRRKAAVKRIWAVFSSSHPPRRWRVDEELVVSAVFGNATIDLRNAEVTAAEIDITAVAVFGNIQITVPEGLEVELDGFAAFGQKGGRIRDVPVLPGTPVVKVHAFAVFGQVWVSTPRARGSKGSSPRSMSMSMSMPPLPLLTPPQPPVFLRGIEAVADEVASEWPALRSRVAPEGTVTIMFSDIEGFTAMNERLGDYRAQSVLRDHNKLVRRKLDEYDGFEVKVQGDGFMMAFGSAARALRFAVALQQDLAEYNETAEESIRVRMGLHTGEAIRDADDFLGSTVNLASRIAAAARGEEILVSALLRELCAPTGEFTFDSGREMELKGLSQPHRVYSVIWR